MIEISCNNQVDQQYCEILRDIIFNGNLKESRAGSTKSLFGRQMRFNLKDGFPLLTTKKVFMKGIIYELLWFLKGSTNIKYLVDNNVHIWDDDAYRYYKEAIEPWMNDSTTKCIDCKTKENVTLVVKDKEDFISQVKENKLYCIYRKDNPNSGIKLITYYKFGNLGPIYGQQWRNWGGVEIDQIQEIINTLKTNPNDRRIILSAYNVGELKNMALPPCHIMAQFYTRKLSNAERFHLFNEHNGNYWKNYIELDNEELDKLNAPKYALSCMFFCRSQDFPLGTPFNIASYALLTHMIAHVCNMDVDELIWNGGDCHVYLNQIGSVKEQLNRKGFKDLPKLTLNPEIKNIDDFKYEDIKIENYQCEETIKIPLSVGL